MAKGRKMIPAVLTIPEAVWRTTEEWGQSPHLVTDCFKYHSLYFARRNLYSLVLDGVMADKVSWQVTNHYNPQW